MGMVMAAHLAEGSLGGAVVGAVPIPSHPRLFSSHHGHCPCPIPRLSPSQALSSWPLVLLLSEVSHGPHCFLEICTLGFGDKPIFLFLISFAVSLTQNKEGGKGYLGLLGAVLSHCRMIPRVFLTAIGVRTGVAGYFASHLLFFLLGNGKNCFNLQRVRLSAWSRSLKGNAWHSSAMV